MLLRNLTVAMLFITAYHVGAASRSDDIEFNTDIVDVADRENIDFSRFSRAGYMMPGNYTLTLYINNDTIPGQSVDWFNTDDDEKETQPCLNSALVKMIGLNPEFASQFSWWHRGECLVMANLPGLTLRNDPENSALYLSVPQRYLEYRVPNWDPPAQWDDGIPGVLFDYYASVQTRKGSRAGRQNSAAGNGTLGINAGAWRLRGDGQARYDDHTGQAPQWRWTRVYARRALPSIGANLVVGQNAFYSDIFDSVSFTGASLLSDDNMLPPNLRGYAPEISGVAKTNASVIVSQQGRIIQATQVAAGPFRITDLNEAVAGELDIRVEEQDGAVQAFTLNTASVPFLTRPGAVRYKLAAGKLSTTPRRTEGPEFAAGELSWGGRNGWSLYGGTIGSEQYNALATGIGWDMQTFGALSLDVTGSSARGLSQENGPSQRGTAWRLSYAKHVDETRSDIALAGYRYAERGYMSLGDYQDAQQYRSRGGSGKELYTANLSQPLRDWQMSLFLNYSHRRYWDRPDNRRLMLTVVQYVTLRSLPHLSLSATLYRNTSGGPRDDGIYVSLSMPFGERGNLSYSGSVTPDNQTHQASYYATLDERNSYQIGSGSSQNGALASGFVQHRADSAQINASASYQAGHYSVLSFSTRGGVTASGQGAALHRINIPGGSRMLLDTAGVAGVPIRTYAASVRSNRFGKAVVTDISNYYRNRFSIDVNAMPDNAEVMGSVIQKTLTEGAIGYGQFDVVSGRKAMAVLRLESGESPPFGAMVKNMKRQTLGVVGDDGAVYLSGIVQGAQMQVYWQGKAQCDIVLPERITEDVATGLLLPCRIPSVTL